MPLNGHFMIIFLAQFGLLPLFLLHIQVTICHWCCSQYFFIHTVCILFKIVDDNCASFKPQISQLKMMFMETNEKRLRDKNKANSNTIGFIQFCIYSYLSFPVLSQSPYAVSQTSRY